MSPQCFPRDVLSQWDWKILWNGIYTTVHCNSPETQSEFNLCGLITPQSRCDPPSDIHYCLQHNSTELFVLALLPPEIIYLLFILIFLLLLFLTDTYFFHPTGQTYCHLFIFPTYCFALFLCFFPPHLSFSSPLPFLYCTVEMNKISNYELG